MQRRQGETLFSAGDIVGFLECEHATTLALQDLETPLARAKDDDSLRLIQDKGFAHEADFLSGLKKQGLGVAEIASDGSPAALARATEQAMREGHDVIFQAALLSGPGAGPFFGRADFLRRVEEPSALGAWRYEPADTKLARNPKAKFLVQLAFYADLLTELQGAEPRAMHLALGDGTEHAYRVANFSRYYGQVRERFLDFTAKHPNDTYPERCDHCPFCPWRNLLAGTRWTDPEGRTRLEPSDLLVVAPYNAQVSALRRTLAPLGVTRVGTVDKFQGQEAPIVLYSCTASSPQIAPRGMAFLHDPHRFNVATSRRAASSSSSRVPRSSKRIAGRRNRCGGRMGFAGLGKCDGGLNAMADLIDEHLSRRA